MAEHNVQCFYGVLNESEKDVKKNSGEPEDDGKLTAGKSAWAAVAQTLDATGPGADVADVQLNQKSASKIKYISKAELNSEYPHRPSPEYDAFITFVNGNSALSWSANTCLLSKGHKDRSEEECDHRVSNNALLYEYMQLADPEEQAAPQEMAQASQPKKFGEGAEFTAAMAQVGHF